MGLRRSSRDARRRGGRASVADATRPADFSRPTSSRDGRGLILSGKTRRGKTHLAIAIAYRAIQNGFDALFTTAAALIDDLSRASRGGHMRESLALCTHPHVLVIAEVGYLTYGSEAANVLFHVVDERRLERRPMIFTTEQVAPLLGAASFTTRTSLKPSSTASSSADARALSSRAPRSAPGRAP